MSAPAQVHLDASDRRIINELQGGFDICERPFAAAAGRLAMSEDELIARVARLVEAGAVSRFAPMYNAEALGGAVTLCAMAVPEDRFEEVADKVNAHGEVAHNYARDHRLNMWFVIAVETPDEIAPVIARIEAETGLAVHNFPKQREFFIEFKVRA